MTLSKRERYIVIITVAVVGILGLDRFFVSPLLARMDEAKTKIDSLSTQLEMSYSLTAKLMQLSLINYV